MHASQDSLPNDLHVHARNWPEAFSQAHAFEQNSPAIRWFNSHRCSINLDSRPLKRAHMACAHSETDRQTDTHTAHLHVYVYIHIYICTYMYFSCIQIYVYIYISICMHVVADSTRNKNIGCQKKFCRQRHACTIIRYILCGMLKNRNADHIGSKSYIVELRCCGDSANCINKLKCKVGHRISKFHVRQKSIIQQIRVIEPQ